MSNFFCGLWLAVMSWEGIDCKICRNVIGHKSAGEVINQAQAFQEAFESFWAGDKGFGAEGEEDY